MRPFRRVPLPFKREVYRLLLGREGVRVQRAFFDGFKA